MGVDANVRSQRTVVGSEHDQVEVGRGVTDRYDHVAVSSSDIDSVSREARVDEPPTKHNLSFPPKSAFEKRTVELRDRAPRIGGVVRGIDCPALNDGGRGRSA
jgi:hypothetical protein